MPLVHNNHMKKLASSLIPLLAMLCALCSLTSCGPIETYTVRTEIIGDRDTLRAGDPLKVVRYFDSSKYVVIENQRTGEEHHIDSCGIYNLYNIENGKNFLDDQATLQHDNLAVEYMPKLDIPDETMEKLKLTVVIGATALLVLLITGFVLVCMEVTPGKFFGVCLYVSLMLISVITNMAYLLYQCGEPKKSGFYDYLFSPGDYGWLMTIFYWIVFFLLSTTNLVAFRATIFISEAATDRKFHGDFVFVALLAWFIIYMFSPNTLNPYFIYALYAIMALHFIFLSVSNCKASAPVWEMLCIYIYFWLCLFPVFFSTVSTIVLIPVLLGAFIVVRSIPGMLVAGFSGETLQAEEKSRSAIKGEKACTFCGHYDQSGMRCTLSDSHKARYGTDAYSCPYYD